MPRTVRIAEGRVEHVRSGAGCERTGKEAQAVQAAARARRARRHPVSRPHILSGLSGPGLAVHRDDGGPGHDEAGHQRFIEGDITFNEIEGLTQTYGKWSLSGSHLLIVIAGSIANETAISGTIISSIDLPAWIKDKLVPIYGQAIVRQTDYAYSSDGATNQSVLNVLGKSGANIYVGSYITATADRYFRYQFDLLIDTAA